MKRRSESGNRESSLRDRIVGLGERSLRKSYYPQLRQQLDESEKARRALEEKSVALLNMLEDLEEARGSLADSEARYRALVENINDVIFRLDSRGKIAYVSPVVRNFGGLTPAQIVGHAFNEFVHPDDWPAVTAAFERVLAGHPEPREFRLLNGEGGTYHVRASSRPLVEAGRVVGLTGVIVDITKRKAAEEKLNEINRDLERRVSERTAQLEVAIHELEAFSFSVSHDLRAPLRHIDGFLGLLKEKIAATLDADGQHYLEATQRAARTMGALINDLLSFSRMARSEMLTTQLDLGALVQEIVQELEPDTDGRAIYWHIGDLPPVSADRAMLKVVLVNLISNALKFTRKCPQADIEIGCLPGNDNETVVFVRDNGAGFDMNMADKLFGAFQRLHRVDEFDGTGIGLATVRRVINRHSGRTWAEAKVDNGATFYFSLPRTGQVQ